jgi:hypothetical protein
MLSADYRAARAIMDTHLQQAHQRADLERLRLQAGVHPQGWLACHVCQALSGLGSVLVGAGQKLERYGLRSVMPVEKEPQTGSWSPSR